MGDDYYARKDLGHRRRRRRGRLGRHGAFAVVVSAFQLELWSPLACQNTGRGGKLTVTIEFTWRRELSGSSRRLNFFQVAGHNSSKGQEQRRAHLRLIRQPARPGKRLLIASI